MFKIIIYKFLRKLKLLKWFNLLFKLKIYKKDIVIPAFGIIGQENIFHKKSWVDNLYEKFLLNINSNFYFIDVGANIGQTLLRVKSLSYSIKYIGFEPNSVCSSYVQKLIQINNFQDCTILSAALSFEVEVVGLSKFSDTDSCATIVKDFRRNLSETNESVISLNYDQLFLYTPISFIKVDVEGSELEVLRGMESSIKKYNPLILCEVLDFDCESLSGRTKERANLLSVFLASINYGIIRLYTSESKILKYELLKNINLSIWTSESLSKNDYLFYPFASQKSVLLQLESLL